MTRIVLRVRAERNLSQAEGLKNESAFQKKQKEARAITFKNARVITRKQHGTYYGTNSSSSVFDINNDENEYKIDIRANTLRASAAKKREEKRGSDATMMIAWFRKSSAEAFGRSRPNASFVNNRPVFGSSFSSFSSFGRLCSLSRLSSSSSRRDCIISRSSMCSTSTSEESNNSNTFALSEERTKRFPHGTILGKYLRRTATDRVGESVQNMRSYAAKATNAEALDDDCDDLIADEEDEEEKRAGFNRTKHWNPSKGQQKRNLMNKDGTTARGENSDHKNVLNAEEEEDDDEQEEEGQRMNKQEQVLESIEGNVFRGRERLKSDRDFDRVKKYGRSLNYSCIRMKALSNLNVAGATGCHRIGIVVPKKQIKRAVDRNLCKRRIRAIFRTNKEKWPMSEDGGHIDFVIFVKTEALEGGFALLEKEMFSFAEDYSQREQQSKSRAFGTTPKQQKRTPTSSSSSSGINNNNNNNNNNNTNSRKNKQSSQNSNNNNNDNNSNSNNNDSKIAR